jgi:hypothetical protein
MIRGFRMAEAFLRLDLAVPYLVHSSYLPIFNGVPIALPRVSQLSRSDRR